MSGGLILERDAEQAALATALHAAREGQGGVVLVEGSPGSGKSTLLAAAREQAAALGMTVLASRGSELEHGLLFGVARQLLDDAAPPDLGEGWSDADTPAGGRAAARIAELHASLRSLVWPAGEQTVPALLAVDDAHWADELSLGFLAFVALRAEELPVALVVAARPREPDGGSATLDALRGAAGRTLSPQPLSADAVASLTREELGEHVDDAVSRACLRVTGGNPFYVRELLRALAADGTAADVEQVQTLAPERVLRSVSVRVGRLGDGAADLARAVAVLGDGASLAEADALAGVGAESAEAAADALARAHILAPGEPLAFAHPLIRSTIEADMGAFAWRRAHRRAAELLLARDAGPQRAAVHLLVARPEGDSRAAEVLRAAATAAAAGGDAETAARLLRRALEEPPAAETRGALLLELAHADSLSGAPDAAATMELALEHIDDPGRRAHALWSLATLAHVRGDLEDAVVLARRGREELPGGHPLRPRLLAAEVGAASLHPGMQDVVNAVLVPLAQAAAAGDLPDDPVLAAHVAARVALEGPPATVRALAERAVAEDPLIDPHPQGLSPGWLGSALLWVDELEFAASWLDAAVDAADARGALLAGATARLQRAWSGLLRGRLEDAATDAEHALQAHRDGLTPSPWSAFVLVSAHVARGDLDEAAEALDVGLGAGAETPEHGLLLLSQCELELARQDPDAALAVAREAGRYIDERFGVALPRMFEWRRWAALAAHRAGDDAQGRALLEPVLARLREIGPARQLGAALGVAGLVAADRDEGLALLEEGAQVLEQSPARLEHARALFELGSTLRRRGSRTAAKAPLYAALELADRFGAAPLEAAVREELSALGLRPRRAALTGVASLTASERRVALLAARGLSTPQIAHELYVTRKTVETHLGHVYRKLDVGGRGELAALRSQLDE